MHLAKIQTPAGATYVAVEPDGDGGFTITGAAPAPAYDALPAYTGAALAGPLAAQTLLPPVLPTKIVCVGRNYKDHAAELGNDVPKEPLLFLKPPSSLIGAGATVAMPAASKRVDFEGELAIVIGERCHRLAADADVRPLIYGYTLVNDVTARDLQKTDNTWTRGKCFDTFCPAGPVLRLANTDFDPTTQPLTLTTHRSRVDGQQELCQSGSTADFIFDIPTLIRYISQIMTLEPGDLIPTGTPAGVGPVAPGESISVHVPGLGTLTNPFAPE